MIKIISGGQTGVDRAALDVAIMLNFPHGGWCPKGRLAEDSTIPSSYCLKETASADYSERTKLNIHDSDATIIIVPEKDIKITDGTILTIEEVKKLKKPYLIISLSEPPSPQLLVKWIKENKVTLLNIAGPRESQSPGIYKVCFNFLLPTLSCLISYKEDHVELLSDSTEITPRPRL